MMRLFWPDSVAKLNNLSERASGEVQPFAVNMSQRCRRIAHERLVHKLSNATIMEGPDVKAACDLRYVAESNLIWSLLPCRNHSIQHRCILTLGARTVHSLPRLPMKDKIQQDPEEVWIFGFGSIIYKQGSCLQDPALHFRHKVANQISLQALNTSAESTGT